ncbi:MAG: hypothetical protein ACK481_04480 [Candidatus Melainabacteria bacterium]|jgi:hypothetical protein
MIQSIYIKQISSKSTVFPVLAHANLLPFHIQECLKAAQIMIRSETDRLSGVAG